MKKKSLITGILLCAVLFIGGCGEKEAEIQAELKQEIPTYMAAQAEKATVTEENLSFYLPEGSKVIAKQENNVTLKTEYGEFVIFANPVEANDSQTNYEILKKMNKEKNVFIDETFDADGFQYVYIIKDKKYEVSVGVGGVKASALVKKKGNLQAVVQQLIQVVKSVSVIQDETDASQESAKTEEK